MKIRVPTAIGLSLISTLAGCDPVDVDDIDDIDAQDEITARELEDNGYRLNGYRLNGFRLNGFRLNGFSLTGEAGGSISLYRVRLPDYTVAVATWLENGELYSLSSLSSVLWGTQLLGTQLDFHVDDGSGTIQDLTVRIAAVGPLEPGSDVLRYDFTIKNDGGPWHPLCADALGNQTGSVLLNDVWSPTTGDRVSPRPSGAATVACLDAALGKCVAWGYVPWKSVGATSLYDYHQTCTRAIRADYCGDGVPHTVDGTEIHVLDQIGIETVEPNSTYVVEAEWGPHGAACLNPNNTRLSNQTIECGLPLCGESFASGGQIQTGKVVL